MSSLKKLIPMVALVAVVALSPASANAQEQRFRVSFAPSVAAMDGDAEVAFSGTAAYRFSEHFWFEGDLTWLDAAAGGLRDRRFPVISRSRSRPASRTSSAATACTFGRNVHRAAGAGESARLSDLPDCPERPQRHRRRLDIHRNARGSLRAAGADLARSGRISRAGSASMPPTRICASNRSGSMRPRRAPGSRSTAAPVRASASGISCGPTWTPSTSACRTTATSCGWAAASATAFRSEFVVRSFSSASVAPRRPSRERVWRI